MAFVGPQGGFSRAVFPSVLITAAINSAKKITLPLEPEDPTEVIVSILGGTAQKPGLDYEITGTELSWDGFGMETFDLTGERLVILYSGIR